MTPYFIAECFDFDQHVEEFHKSMDELYNRKHPEGRSKEDCRCPWCSDNPFRRMRASAPTLGVSYGREYDFAEPGLPAVTKSAVPSSRDKDMRVVYLDECCARERAIDVLVQADLAKLAKAKGSKADKVIARYDKPSLARSPWSQLRRGQQSILAIGYITFVLACSTAIYLIQSNHDSEAHAIQVQACHRYNTEVRA